MFNHPNENQVQWTRILTEQFECKGYKCQEIKEEDATVLILRTEKKHDKEKNDFSIMNRSYGKTRIN